MLQISFQPFPVVHTARLILRQPLATDAPDLFLMRSDPVVMQYIPRPLAQTHNDVIVLLDMMNGFAEKGERVNWAIEWRETGQVIGMIGFVNIKPEHHRAEVGYSLTRSWHRRGIMREALQATLAFGFNDMGLHTIEAIIDAENVASGNLLQDAGFRQEAFFREDFLHNGKYRDSIHFGMLRREYEETINNIKAGNNG